ALSNHVLAGLDLRVLARPHLEALEADVGETATLSLPSDPDAITVDFVPSRATVASVARVGRASVAHATATGKVMLAFAGGPPRTRPPRHSCAARWRSRESWVIMGPQFGNSFAAAAITGRNLNGRPARPRQVPRHRSRRARPLHRLAPRQGAALARRGARHPD